MSWDSLLSRPAERALRAVPADDRERLNGALNEMKQDPFSGDFQPLKGAHKGYYRRRVGAYRIIYKLDRARRLVLVADILRRTSGTY